MVVCVRVGVLVILCNVFELLVTEGAVESFEGVRNFALEGCAAGDGVLSECVLV